jgi:hypothetical protein
VLVDGGDVLLLDGVIGFPHGGSLLSKRVCSPILCESGLRTAAQPPTECRTLSVKPDVVTSSGQRADAHGHKLGPSGKPQVNKVQHATKKEAKDAARAEGQAAPVRHPSPKKGKPHFHATDKKGKKKPASTHHEYPD